MDYLLTKDTKIARKNDVFTHNLNTGRLEIRSGETLIAFYDDRILTIEPSLFMPIRENVNLFDKTEKTTQ
jgi:hypothetical protein